jgi:hypothetical protein
VGTVCKIYLIHNQRSHFNTYFATTQRPYFPVDTTLTAILVRGRPQPANVPRDIPWATSDVCARVLVGRGRRQEAGCAIGTNENTAITRCRRGGARDDPDTISYGPVQVGVKNDTENVDAENVGAGSKKTRGWLWPGNRRDAMLPSLRHGALSTFPTPRDPAFPSPDTMLAFWSIRQVSNCRPHKPKIHIAAGDA